LEYLFVFYFESVFIAELGYLHHIFPGSIEHVQ
jgi:hypothetical protein